jgi:hypothetical protein
LVTYYHESSIGSDTAPKIYVDGTDLAAVRNSASSRDQVDYSGGSTYVGDAWALTRGIDARVAELACWDGELGQAQATALAAGCSPLSIAPDSLLNYWPLVRDLHDVAGGLTFTNATSTPVAAHPRIMQPSYPVVSTVSDVPRVISVSTDDDVPATEDPWTIAGTRFGAR